VVTTALIAVIALDDALAMALYSIGKSVASLMSGEGLSLTQEAAAVTTELGGAVAVAACAAFILRVVLLRIHNQDKALAMSISTLFLVIGISVTLMLDVIRRANYRSHYDQAGRGDRQEHHAGRFHANTAHKRHYASRGISSQAG
jgi:ABC-type nickel/cobalt efflux system permease component RcnA